MKSAGLYVLVGLLFLITSCEKYIEYEGENAMPKLVVNGAMEKDSAISVNVSYSLGMLDEGQPGYVENAQVDLFDGEGNFVQTMVHTGNGDYQADMVAVSGKNYSLEISAENYNSISVGSTVPYAIPITSADTSSVEGENGNIEHKINFTVNDPSEEDNYYFFAVVPYDTNSQYQVEPVFDPETGEISFDTINYNYGEIRASFRTSDPVLTSNNSEFAMDDSEVYLDDAVFSDELFNGESHTFRITLNIFGEIPDGEGVDLMLLSCNRDFYLYLASINAFHGADGNPFAQPVQVYSNVEGDGLGTWGAVARYIYPIHY